MSTFHLEIVATDKVFYRGDCDFLVFPGLDGEHGILSNHEVMVSAVKAGELHYKVGDTTYFDAVGDGLVEVLSDKVVLICDFAERPEDIDTKRAQLAKERAEERLKMHQSDIDFAHSQAAIARAMARLKVANRNRGIKD